MWILIQYFNAPPQVVVEIKGHNEIEVQHFETKELADEYGEENLQYGYWTSVEVPATTIWEY